MAFAVAALASDGTCDGWRRIGGRVFSRIFRYTTSDNHGLNDYGAEIDLTLQGLVHDLNNVFQTIAEHEIGKRSEVGEAGAYIAAQRREWPTASYIACWKPIAPLPS